MNAATIVKEAMGDAVDELRRPCGVAEKAGVMNQVRDAHPEIVPVLEVDRLVGFNFGFGAGGTNGTFWSTAKADDGKN